MTREIGQLAQLVERRPYKAVAAGSSPALPTKYFKGLSFKGNPFFSWTQFFWTLPLVAEERGIDDPRINAKPREK